MRNNIFFNVRRAWPLLSRVFRVSFLLLAAGQLSSAQWAQLQGDAGRSGDAPEEDLKASLGLLAALPLTDGVQATPVVADGMVFVVDGSGVVHAISLSTFQVQWRFDTEGGAGNGPARIHS